MTFKFIFQQYEQFSSWVRGLDSGAEGLKI